MQFSSRLTIAVHSMLCMIEFKDKCKITSNFLASSVNVNPVIIRQILGQLKEAGLVTVEAGVGGASLTKEAAGITLLDIFQAVEKADEALFHFHEHPNPACPVGRIIHSVMDDKLKSIQAAMESGLQSITLQALADDMKKKILGSEASGKQPEDVSCQ